MKACNQPKCHRCYSEMNIDFSEPGEWCKDEHCPDGYFEMDCSFCGKDNYVVVTWLPTYFCEDPEVF
jgi:hypothetical protein